MGAGMESGSSFYTWVTEDEKYNRPLPHPRQYEFKCRAPGDKPRRYCRVWVDQPGIKNVIKHRDDGETCNEKRVHRWNKDWDYPSFENDVVCGECGFHGHLEKGKLEQYLYPQPIKD